MSSFQVYGDFNCPFCYALEERLRDFSEDHEIEWRPIQHVPNLMNLSNVEDLAELASEVFTVRHRSPDLAIAMPRLRPNSALVNEIYIAIQSRDHGLAGRFRERVFEALWKEGLDISTTEVVESLLAELGIARPEPRAEEQDSLAAFQRQWQSADPNRRIPIMTADDGRVLPGLSCPRDIECFLAGSEPSGEPSGVCEFIPSPVVLVIGHPAAIWHLVDAIQPEIDLLVASDCLWAKKLIEDGLKPDLLLLSSVEGDEALLNCRELQQISEGADTPIMIVDQDTDPERELNFLQCGAAGYFQATANPQLFKARVSVHLANKTRRDHLLETVRLDPLTRIPNRRELERVLEVEWRRGVYSKLPISVALLDVDYFKKYNDTYGHQAGDQCLVQLTTALQNALRREADFVARYGGEEFVLVLPDCTKIGAQEIAETCRKSAESLEIPHSESAVAPVVTISLGLTTVVPSLETNLHMVLKTADRALYQAKSKGRNQIYWASVGEVDSAQDPTDQS